MIATLISIYVGLSILGSVLVGYHLDEGRLSHYNFSDTAKWAGAIVMFPLGGVILAIHVLYGAVYGIGQVGKGLAEIKRKVLPPKAEMPKARVVNG